MLEYQAVANQTRCVSIKSQPSCGSSCGSSIATYAGTSFSSVASDPSILSCPLCHRTLQIRTPWHHPGRVVYKCNDQTRTTEPLVCMPLFRLISIKLFFDFELANFIIVGVQSTACNHGQVLRGCMIMQSTTCHSQIRSESLSRIKRLHLYQSVTFFRIGDLAS